MAKWKNKSEILTVIVAVLFIAVISAAQHKSIVTLDAEEDSIRLPKSVIPVHYDLSLTTNVHTGARAFNGNVNIRVRIAEDTSSITLHNSGLTIDTIQVTNSSSGSSIGTTFVNNATRAFLIITTGNGEVLQLGEEFDVAIVFRGNLATNMEGFYRSQYQVDGETVPRLVLIDWLYGTSHYLIIQVAQLLT